MLELHQPEHTGDPCFDLGPGQPTQFQPEGDVAGDREMRKQSVGLEHHTDLTLVGRHARQIAPCQRHLAGVGARQTGDYAQKRRFPAARGTEQCHQFATRNC